MLHVTNGESVSLDRTGLGGEILTWVDVLHEGPVPAGMELDQLSRLRGIFLDGIWPSSSSAVDSLARRDAALARFQEHEEVVLWFEHDLFDQLQLIQILDWLHDRADSSTRFSLISVDRYLGQLTGQQLATLWPNRHTITPPEFDLAVEAWRAFRAPDPLDLEHLLGRDTSALPFLAGALQRHLQQFPSVGNGLARTERQILELVDSGQNDFARLFRADQQMEERIFMGDTSFARYIHGLAGCRRPLLLDEDGRYRVTPTGRQVLASEADHVHLNGINRWLGGVHLSGTEALWRWDERAQRLVRH
jgi:hypothetical protein